MVSIKTVAERAGTSVATVSRYFHEPERVHAKTRTRIQEAVSALGYAPNHIARSFRRGNTKVILVLTSGVGDPFSGTLLDAICAVAEPAGYTIRMQKTRFDGGDESSFLELIASRQADGIIIVGNAGSLSRGLRHVDAAAGLPVVICGETSDPNLQHMTRFQVDGRTATREATEYLLRLGHRRIAFISGSISMLRLTDREDGFRDAHEANGLPLDPRLMQDGAFSADETQLVVSDLLSMENRPTAIMCATDEMALGALAELRKNGIDVPGEMSVIGFDDTRYARIASPPLTTVSHPIEEIARRGIHTLLRILNGWDYVSGIHRLSGQLVVRGSTAAAKGPAR